MSTVWSWWVIGFIVFNLALATFLLLWGTRIEIPTREDGTTGHIWAHGVLREAVRKLPLWWYVLSVSMLGFGVVYFYLYPGFGNNDGKLDWSSTKQHAEQVDKNMERYAPVLETVRNSPMSELKNNEDITRIGGVLYHDNCEACHGRNAQGNQYLGAPNLLDDVWLYGSSEAEILHSINKGREGMMPGWPQFGIGRVKNLAHYVRSLSGLSHGSVEAAVARDDFIESCAVCHGVEGKGNPAVGAPNLTDDEWLYGSDMESIKHSIREGRHGVMPGWEERLTAEEIKMITAWMLGAGDATQ